MKTKEELKLELNKLKSEEKSCRDRLLKAYSELHTCEGERAKTDIDKRIKSLYNIMKIILKETVKTRIDLDQVDWVYPDSWHCKPII